HRGTRDPGYDGNAARREHPRAGRWPPRCETGHPLGQSDFGASQQEGRERGVCGWPWPVDALAVGDQRFLRDRHLAVVECWGDKNYYRASEGNEELSLALFPLLNIFF